MQNSLEKKRRKLGNSFAAWKQSNPKQGKKKGNREQEDMPRQKRSNGTLPAVRSSKKILGSRPTYPSRGRKPTQK